ncbi:MAG: phage antirepressor KilAC domain-containing protein [Mycetocola sp.]
MIPAMKMPGAGTPGEDKIGMKMSGTQAINIVEDAEGDLRVSSLIIAQQTAAQHKNILELVRNNLTDLEAFGLVAFETRARSQGQHGGGDTTYALLNEPQSTLLITYMRNSEVVKAFKLALVKEFYRMRQALAGQVVVPRSLPDALRAYAVEVEKSAALEAKVQADAPKVLFADSVATSDATILVGELAKILRGNGITIGQNRLFAKLRDDGFLIKREGTDYNMPTQKAMELELFQIKETAITHSDGHVTVNKTPKVTGKGQAYFINRYTLSAA